MNLGLVINPLAGLGGAVALKGTDGADIVEQALARGAEPHAGERCLQALQQVHDGAPVTLLTCAGAMGADCVAATGLVYRSLYTPAGATTSAEDTRRAVACLCEAGIDLLLFAGGDGTARDVLDALADLGLDERLPVIGIPAGCKIQSAVYAITPRHAGELLDSLLRGEPLHVASVEVMDLDERAYREGRLNSRCYGYLRVPQDDDHMQVMKQGGVNHDALAVEDIAADIVDGMLDDTCYFIGAGSTTAAIMETLGLEATLLGVDVVMKRELLASDADEQTLLDYLERYPVKIVVSVIGGQGHVFGRGNQQFSPRVLRAAGLDHIEIIATREKLRTLDGRPLRVDTGDEALDHELCGMKQIVTGYEQRTLYRID